MELDGDGNKLIQKMKLGETQKVKTVSVSASSKVDSQARAGEGFDSLFVGGGVTPTLSALHRQQDQVAGASLFFGASLFQKPFLLAERRPGPDRGGSCQTRFGTRDGT